MTVKELSQLYWLTREIERDTERLMELRLKSESVSSPNLSGVNVMGGDPGRRVEQMAIAIITLEKAIEEKRIRCLTEQIRLETFIATIDDSQLRQLFTLRFINGLNWVQIAHLIGGGNTEEGVKKKVYRYLKSEKNRKK